MQPLMSSEHKLPLLLLPADYDAGAVALPACDDFSLQLCQSLEAVTHVWSELGQGVVVVTCSEHSDGLEKLVMRLRSALPEAAIVVVGECDELRLLLLGVQEVIHRADDHFNALLHRAEVRRQALARQSHYASHDDLTGLASRTLFQDRLLHSLVQGQRRNTDVGLMCIGINRFRLVNDLHGHGVGDTLLIAAAVRMQKVLRRSDTIARLGGDNFAIVLEPVSGEHGLEQVAEKIRTAFHEPFIIEGQEIFVSLRFGMELASRSSFDPDRLLRHAEVAMHQARHDHNGLRIFREKEAPQDRVRAGLESGLHHALEREELYLVYQPQLDVSAGSFTGAEALLRWQHPLLGDVSPTVFIPVLEDTGLISEFGEWALRRAAGQFAEWLRQDVVPASARLSVNLSPRQFSRPDLVISVEAALKDAALPAGNLTLEITESTLMRNMSQGVKVLTDLRGLGVRTAIDDFGTGYSSLAYLKDLPIDYLKIDRTFVKDIVTSSHDAAIASSIISLAHNLGMNVVAEGVEDSEILEVLKLFGCDQYQGFFFSRPVPAADIPALLQRCH